MSAAQPRPGPAATRIERRGAGAQAAFLADFRLRRPVVLTQALSGWPADLFDLAQIGQRFGAEPVLSYRVPGGAAAKRMSAVKADFYQWSDGEGRHEHLCRWTFGELVAALLRGEAHYCMANRTKNTRLRDRLATHAGDVACALLAGTREAIECREFFIGSAGVGPGLHHDGAVETFLCQLVGTKRINAFSPADIAYLYPAASWLAPTGHFSAVADSFDVDAARFPLFARATAHACRLEPGEILYLPPHWYHDTAPEGPSVSLTIRHSPPAEAWGTQAQRDEIARAAGALMEGLRALSPAARVAYAGLLRNDLESAAPPAPGDATRRADD